jgi:hypothetical protein
MGYAREKANPNHSNPSANVSGRAPPLREPKRTCRNEDRRVRLPLVRDYEHGEQSNKVISVASSLAKFPDSPRND